VTEPIVRPRDDAAVDVAGAGDAPLPVLVVAAYPAVRAGLSALLARDPGLRPFERPTTGTLWQADVADRGPAVVVVDLASLPDSGLEAIEDTYPSAPLVLLGANPAVDGPGLGAAPVAYLAPDADAPTLAAAVRGVAAGLTVLDPQLAGAVGVHAHRAAAAGTAPGLSGAGDELTARERQVLALVADGLPNKAIARELGISEHTVKFHVGSLLGKLGAGSRTEAVTLATRRGILAI
jgi:DNA-binding NarL/FixJ family response regulator